MGANDRNLVLNKNGFLNKRSLKRHIIKCYIHFAPLEPDKYVSIGVGALSYFVIIYFMKIEDVDVIVGAINKKLGRGAA